MPSHPAYPYICPLVRDVFFADARSPDVNLGGLVATAGITNAIFHAIVETAMDLPADYSIDSKGETLPRDESPLLPGSYFIRSSVPVSFKQQVRDRDGRCVVSKVQSLGPQYGHWTGFEAAHIVPVACGQWQSRGFQHLVTIPPPPPCEADTINSVQNGLLMQTNFHQLFDACHFAILPEAGYKIIFFLPDIHGLAGTHLDRALLDDDRRPLDAFLRWHFEQAVLCNVRGAGEPVMDFDYPPGSDMMGDILQGPRAAERMEFELFTRLGASRDVDTSD